MKQLLIKRFNTDLVVRRITEYMKSCLKNDFDGDLLEKAEYALSLAAPHREKSYLLFAVGESLNINKESLWPLAITSELIMVAALTADDVFDKSLKREGKISLYASVGADKTFLVSEFMFAVAIKSLFEFRKINQNVSFDILEKIINSFLEAYLAIQKAQYWLLIHDRENLLKLTPSVMDEINRLGLGLLFGITLSAPALLIGDNKQANILDNVGKILGSGLQHSNDIADFIWGEDDLGRIGFEDLLNGQPNLVMAYMNQNIRINKADRDYLLNIWTRYNQENFDREKVKRIIVKSSVIEESQKHLMNLLAQVDNEINLLDEKLQKIIREIFSLIKQ